MGAARLLVGVGPLEAHPAGPGESLELSRSGRRWWRHLVTGDVFRGESSESGDDREKIMSCSFKVS